MEDALVAFKNKYPTYTALYETLLQNNIKFKFTIGPISIDGALAAFYQESREIRFINESSINCNSLEEELIHAVQHNMYGAEMTGEVKNYEYEAKVLRDLVCMSISEAGLSNEGCMLLGMFDQTDEGYSEWIYNFYNTPFTTNNIQRFNDLCSTWTGYSGIVDHSFIPQLLLLYF